MLKFVHVLGAMMAVEAFLSTQAMGYTANRVRFEFCPKGVYRVYVVYTVPALKEFREAYAEFRRKKDAEKFYWDLIKGADFFLPDPKKLRFELNGTKPTPW